MVDRSLDRFVPDWLRGGAPWPRVRRLWVFVGTYTGGKSRGIYRLEFDPTTGKLTEPTVAAESENPSFLAVHPSRRFLYAVNEVAQFEGKPGGSVTGFTLDAKSGALAKLNAESTVGPGPCHLSVDRTGKVLLVANYGGGSVAALPIGDVGRIAKATTFIQHEGSSVDKGRQSEPHAHSINVDAGNRFAIAADLGLDKLFVYKLDPDRGRRSSPNDFRPLRPGRPRLGAAALRLPTRRQARLRHQRVEVDDHRVRLRPLARRPELTERRRIKAAPSRGGTAGRSYYGRGPGASVGEVPLRLEPG